MNPYNLNFLKAFLSENFLANVNDTRTIRNNIVSIKNFTELEQIIIVIDRFIKDEGLQECEKNDIISNSCLGHLNTKEVPLQWLYELEQSIMKVMFRKRN